MDLLPGQRVTVIDAFGDLRQKRVINISAGHGFLACEEGEWTAARREGREPEPEPFAWPTGDVRVQSMSQPDAEPTQVIPAKDGDFEVPIPSREDFLNVVKKVAGAPGVHRRSDETDPPPERSE